MLRRWIQIFLFRACLMIEWKWLTIDSSKVYQSTLSPGQQKNILLTTRHFEVASILFDTITINNFTFGPFLLFYRIYTPNSVWYRYLSFHSLYDTWNTMRKTTSKSILLLNYSTREPVIFRIIVYFSHWSVSKPQWLGHNNQITWDCILCGVTWSA